VMEVLEAQKLAVQDPEHIYLLYKCRKDLQQVKVSNQQKS
jgi:hypothetical protein